MALMGRGDIMPGEAGGELVIFFRNRIAVVVIKLR